MSTINPQKNHLVTPFYLSSKDSINRGHKKRRAMGVERRDTLRETRSARLGLTKFGLGPPRVLRPESKVVEKGKARANLGKAKGEEMPAKGTGKETLKDRRMRAKYLASFGVMEMDTASGAIIADTATVERKEGKEKGVPRFF